MMIASVLFAIMGSLVFYYKEHDPTASSLVASFVRVFINLLFVMVCSFFVRNDQLKVLGFKGLFGDFRYSLWLRGFFGTLSVVSFFYGVTSIGIGEASFLNASHAIWIGILGPFVLRQKSTRLGWAAIGLGVVGLFLLYQPQFHPEDLFGRTIALLSGLFGACAYMMVSRAGRSNHPLSVVFYFTMVASLLHLGWFLYEMPTWPSSIFFWSLLIGAGFCASVAQFYMTLSYQEAPAALVSATSYLTPVLSLVISVIAFQDVPNLQSLIGALIIVIAGVALPFLTLVRNQKAKTIALRVL